MVNSTQTKLVYSGAPSTTELYETQMPDIKIAGNVTKRDNHLILPWDCFWQSDRYLARTTSQGLSLKPIKISMRKKSRPHASEDLAHTVSHPHSVGSWLRLWPPHSVQDPSAKARGHPKSRHEKRTILGVHETHHVKPCAIYWACWVCLNDIKKPNTSSIISESDRWCQAPPSWKSWPRGALPSQKRDRVDEKSIENHL